MPKRHLEAPTQESRAQARKSLGTLKSLTVQPITRVRYQQSLEQFFQYLKDEHLLMPAHHRELDTVASDYLEHLWAKGLGRATASNFLAALQDSQPQLKGKLAQSWRLMKAWVTNEIPNRAPPLPKEVIYAMVGYALFKERPDFAITLLLGFYCLLRTGEILQIKGSHITIQSPKGPAVISLGLTKSGKRQGAAESVTVYNEDLCRRLFQWKEIKPGATVIAGPSFAWRQKFSTTLEKLNFHKWDFRPYSLRRGGATEMFKNEGTFDHLMIVGRWQSIRTARLYVNEGLSVLAEQNLPWDRFALNLKSQYVSSLSRSLPKLERGSSKKTQSRGRWKRTKRGESLSAEKAGN